MNVLKVGSYIRDQRTTAKLSLRKMAGLAGVSIPYLSQVERGLRKPSAEILQAIAKGLRISAETLYVQAGILEERPATDVAAAIMSDLTITEGQKSALIQIYRAFRDETGRAAVADPEVPLTVRGTGSTASARANGSSRAARAKTATSTPGAKGRPKTAVSSPGGRSRRAGGGTVSKAGSSPHPAPTRSPATKSLDS